MGLSLRDLFVNHNSRMVQLGCTRLLKHGYGKHIQKRAVPGSLSAVGYGEFSPTRLLDFRVLSLAVSTRLRRSL